jgi:hypothetical protein
VSGQRHAPAALYPVKETPVSWISGWKGVRAGLDTETRGKIRCLCRGSNSGHPVCSQTLYWLSYQSFKVKLSCYCHVGAKGERVHAPERQAVVVIITHMISCTKLRWVIIRLSTGVTYALLTLKCWNPAQCIRASKKCTHRSTRATWLQVLITGCADVWNIQLFTL